MDVTTNPLTSASSKWATEATAMTLLTISEIPVVEGKFADAINSWILQTKQSLAGFATAASELSTAAGESSDEETKLAAAPTLADIQVMGNRIEGDRKAGRDYSDKVTELKEMVAEHDRCKQELETSSAETQSQTECVSIPEFETLGIEGEPQYIPPEKEGGGNDPTDPPGNKPEGTQPGNTPVGTPETDRKLPDVTSKPETPSAPTPSDAAHTQLSSDSPAPSTTPSTTPSASPTVAQPSSSAAQPQMPQVQMPTSSGQGQSPGGQQGQQATQTPRSIDDLRKKMQEAERKSEKDEDKKADDEAATGDAPGNDVGGAALLTGTAAGVPGAPSAPGAPITPAAPTPPAGTQPPGGGVGGAPVGAMGSGNNAQQKNANIISSQQPEPPMPSAPKVEGSKQSPTFDWNSDAVLPPPPDNKKDTP